MLIPYDHAWRDSKDRHQTGVEDNWWWYLFNKLPKEYASKKPETKAPESSHDKDSREGRGREG